MLKWVGIIAIAWIAFSQAAFSQAAFSQLAFSQPTFSQQGPSESAQAACALFSSPQQFNTQQANAQQANTQQSEQGNEAEVIVIGHQPGRRYRVIVTDGSEVTLNQLRTCVTDAYLTRSRIGNYIQVASFSKRREAETIRRILRRQGYRVRVIYRR